MYCLNNRIGLIYKQSYQENKKSFSIHYFFIDDSNRLYFASSLPRVQKIVRAGRTLESISRMFQQLGEKSIQLEKYNVGEAKQMNNESILPFTNRTYVELKEKQSGKELKLFPLVEENLLPLRDLLRSVSKPAPREQPVQPQLTYPQEERDKENRILQGLFNKYNSLADKFQIKKDEVQQARPAQVSTEKQILELDCNHHYLGEFKDGLPEGEGKEILVDEGLSYNGTFKAGKKHGHGYLVNQNLDTLYCEFIDDNLCGI